MLKISVWLMLGFVIVLCVYSVTGELRWPLACPVYLFHDILSAPMFRHSVWSVIIAYTSAVKRDRWSLMMVFTSRLTAVSLWAVIILQTLWWNTDAESRSWNKKLFSNIHRWNFVYRISMKFLIRQWQTCNIATKGRHLFLHSKSSTMMHVTLYNLLLLEECKQRHLNAIKDSQSTQGLPLHGWRPSMLAVG